MRVIVILFCMAVVVAILSTFGAGLFQNSSNAVLASFGTLLSGGQRFFSLIADFSVRLIDNIYEITPESMRCLMGLAILATGLFSVIGFCTTWSGIRMWKRYL